MSPPMTTAITVVGSLNMDFVAQVRRLPTPGETVPGSGFRMVPGGKGANQACAVAKLASASIDARIVACTGSDLFGENLKASLAAAGVDIRYVRASKSEPTGVALIPVDESGQNSIVVAPGANDALNPADIEAMSTALEDAAFVLLQLETPLATVEAGLILARRAGARTILDPAPARTLPDALLDLVDILTPNESEGCILLGGSAGRVAVDEAPRMARELLRRGPRGVVLKLGDRGCFYSDGVTEIHCPSFAVEAVDATAAGDTFNGALAVTLGEGRSVREALRFANAAAAVCVTRWGAQDSIPVRAEVDAFMGQRGQSIPKNRIRRWGGS